MSGERGQARWAFRTTICFKERDEYRLGLDLQIILGMVLVIMFCFFAVILFVEH